jgi:hypothetical protein
VFVYCTCTLYYCTQYSIQIQQRGSGTVIPVLYSIVYYTYNYRTVQLQRSTVGRYSSFEGAVLAAVLVRDVEHVARKYRLLK